MFVPIQDRCFALTFGLVYHNLSDDSIEHDFGLRVTLNCVDPKELRSTDTVDPGAARRKRTQMPMGADLTFFDFDRDSSVVKSITGKVSAKYEELFRHVTGASSLSISLDCSAKELGGRCAQLLELYNSEVYKTTFPDLQNIMPVRDAGVINQLNAALVSAVREGDDSLYLVIPEIVDYSSGVHYVAFTGEGPSLLYEDVFFGTYIEYLIKNAKDRTSLSLDDLKRQGVDLCDDDEVRKKHYSVYRCLMFETKFGIEEQTYHLLEGKWYRVEDSYVQRLKSKLDPLCVDLGMPPYSHDNEGAYNKAVAIADKSFICLDLADISPDGQSQIEPCDLYRVEGGAGLLYHVKRSTVSAQLSHLFNQGTNAFEILRIESASRGKLGDLIVKVAGQNNPLFPEAPLSSRAFGVRFVIVTHKSPTKKSDNLPLFSRISLNRTVKLFELMNAECLYGFVSDVSPKKVAKPRSRKKKPEAAPSGTESSAEPLVVD